MAMRIRESDRKLISIADMEAVAREQTEWQAFLANSPSPQAYRLRHRCVICRTPIMDRNKTGVCSKCQEHKPQLWATIVSRKDATPGMGESKKHLALKELAKAYLFATGFTQVTTEYKFGLKIGHIKVDVFGSNHDKTAIVECGGCTEAKLNYALRYTPLVYILPYGYTIPIQWVQGMKLCHACGNIVYHPLVTADTGTTKTID